MELGSLPEWASLIISLGGFILIYSTLQSQIGVQKAQLRQLDIEHKRYSKENLPTVNTSVSGFDFEFFITKPGFVDDNNRYVFNVGFNLFFENGAAHNISIIPNFPKLSTWSDDDRNNLYKFDFLNIGEKVELEYFVQGILGMWMSPKETEYIFRNRVSFGITFYDDLHNKYIQHITYNLSEGYTNNPIISHPVLLESSFTV